MEREQNPLENSTRQEHWKNYVKTWLLLPQILAGLLEQLTQLNKEFRALNNRFNALDKTSEEALSKLEEINYALDTFTQLIPRPLLFKRRKKK